MKKKITFSEIMNNLPPKTSRPDVLGDLGPAVRRIPFELYSERLLFRGALNTALREKTGVFPVRLGKAGEHHPIYLLREVGNYAFQACPCTSKRQAGTCYVRKGCVLEQTQREMDKTSYLLERYVFNLSRDDAFHRHLVLMGRVPESCLGRTLRMPT